MTAIYFLILYYPIHEVLLKFSGTSGPSLFVLRQWADLLIIVAFVAVSFGKIMGTNGGVRISYIGALLIVFLAYSIALSFSITQNDTSIALSEIFVLLRFTTLIAIIGILNPTKEQILLATKLILVSAIFQVLVGVIQYAGGSAVIDIFRPVDYTSIISESERSFTSNRELDRRMLIGTAGDFISFGYIIAIGSFIALVHQKSALLKMFILIFFPVILFIGGSRIIFLGTIFSIILFFILTSSSEKKIIYSFALSIALAVIFVLLSDLSRGVEFEYDNFLAVFSPQFIENLLDQRLGVLVFVAPEFIKSGHFLTGLSPDKQYITTVVSAEYENVPWILTAVLYSVIEDFFLLVLFIYYGIFGFSVLIAVYVFLWRTVWRVYRLECKVIGSIGILTILSGIFFNLSNQAFENRNFAFLFWLLMAFNMVMDRRSKNNAHPPHP